MCTAAQGKKMSDHRIKIQVDGRVVETLEDILPSTPGLRILFVAKTPAPVSVEAGHYFQGKQGRMLWNKLSDYDILKVPYGEYEDDHLLENGYGLTDIVKVPKHFGDEPSNDEYRDGLQRILDLMRVHKPRVVVFVYKRVLDNILKLGFRHRGKSEYGFNSELGSLLGSKVFVFPMPGTPCTTEKAHEAMVELREILAK